MGSTALTVSRFPTLFIAEDHDYERQSANDPFPVGAVAGAVTAVAVCLLIAVVIIILWRKGTIPLSRNRKENPSLSIAGDSTKSRGTYEFTNLSASLEKAEGNASKVVYENLGSARSAVSADKPVISPKPFTSPKPNLLPKPNSAQVSSSIPQSGLLQYYCGVKANGDETLEAEYKSVPVEMGVCSVAAKPENKVLNRYQKIYPYDDNRVILKDEDNDYINASYIKGYNEKVQYIAAQAPKESTVAKFVKMIWQEKVTEIVMLNKLFEDGKERCRQYWEDELQGSRKFGFIDVTTAKIEQKGAFAMRHFDFHHRNFPQARRVVQYHYTQWPDFGAPFTADILKLWDATQKPNRQGPLLVYCSAGVGRTGTFIALDLLLSSPSSVNFKHCLEYLRQQRMLMIQRPLQYIFVHDAVVEALIAAPTTFTFSKFLDWVHLANAKTQRATQLQVLQNVRVIDKASDNENESNASGRNYSVFCMNEANSLELTEPPQNTLEREQFWSGVYKKRMQLIVLLHVKPEALSSPTAVGAEHRAGSLLLRCADTQTLHGVRTDTLVVDKIKENVVYQNLNKENEEDEPLKLKLVYADLVSTPPVAKPPVEYANNEQVTSGALYANSGEVGAEALSNSTDVLAAILNRLLQSESSLVVSNEQPSRVSLCTAYVTMSRSRETQEVDVYSAAKLVQLMPLQLTVNKNTYEQAHEVVAKFLENNQAYSNFV